MESSAKSRLGYLYTNVEGKDPEQVKKRMDLLCRVYDKQVGAIAPRIPYYEDDENTLDAKQQVGALRELLALLEPVAHVDGLCVGALGFSEYVIGVDAYLTVAQSCADWPNDRSALVHFSVGLGRQTSGRVVLGQEPPKEESEVSELTYLLEKHFPGGLFQPVQRAGHLSMGLDKSPYKLFMLPSRAIVEVATSGFYDKIPVRKDTSTGPAKKAGL